MSPLFGVKDYCGGATLALRRDALESIGGFAAVKDQLADDWWLGHLTREQGLRTVVPLHIVTTDVSGRGLGELWAQELRWMRTTRLLAPPGVSFLFLTMCSPMLTTGDATASAVSTAMVVAMRETGE